MHGHITLYSRKYQISEEVPEVVFNWISEQDGRYNDGFEIIINEKMINDIENELSLNMLNIVEKINNDEKDMEYLENDLFDVLSPFRAFIHHIQDLYKHNFNIVVSYCVR